MRLTVDEAIKRGINGKVRVTLNGEAVSHVVVADEEQGYIERFKQVGGRMVIDRNLGEAVREIIKGIVVIEVDDNEQTMP